MTLQILLQNLQRTAKMRMHIISWWAQCWGKPEYSKCPHGLDYAKSGEE